MTATRQAIDRLYSEAVALADEARGWFDGAGQHWRRQLPPASQALVATESLEVTSRLMAVMSWLLDPAHGHAGLAVRPFIADTGIDRPLLPVLAGTPGGDIALASRQLAARVGALANSSYLGDEAL